jgi:hypothetical protein
VNYKLSFCFSVIGNYATKVIHFSLPPKFYLKINIFFRKNNQVQRINSTFAFNECTKQGKIKAARTKQRENPTGFCFSPK